MKRILILSFVLFAALQTIVTAQNIKYRALDSSELWFDGTSTLHDFTCHANKIDATVVVSTSLLDGKSGETQKGQVTIPVKKIKNENDGLTKNMYKTLEPDKWPEINFALDMIKLSREAQKEEIINADIHGALTIKGETRDISMPVEITGLENADTLNVSGSYLLLLSDFEIKRPSFFLGTLKVGDEIDISFDLRFVRENDYKELTQR